LSDFCPATELARLREDYGAIARLLERSGDSLARVVPPVSGWSAEQHLAHLALANELVCRNLKSLLRGSGALVQDDGDPSAEALAILTSGRFPRGAAQSPRMVRPPEQVRRDFLAEWLASNRLDFEELSARTGEIEAAHRRIPHQVLGPLTASRWVRFAAMHTRHHLDIAREVLAACS
jgi:hypothetical protein